MATEQYKRIKSLSTRYLGFYKNSVILILIGIGCLLLYGNIASYRETGKFQINSWFVTGYILFFIYLWIRMNRNVHRVEFDDEFLYVIQKGQDIIIPLENFNEVDLKTLGGVYEVELFQAEQLGKKFYFKPSLVYPFNFKEKDALVDVLRNNINRAYQRKHTIQRNALHS